MSKSSSTTPPAPCSGADSNGADAAIQARILAAGQLLADNGVYGFVWLDRQLDVLETYGRLAEFVAVGRPITDSIIALVGLGTAIDELAGQSVPFVDLPAVAIRETDAPETRLNLTFYWMAPWQRHLLLLSRALPRSNLEQQLTQQMRARLMAEADARALAQRLAVANRDLDEFASIISHDLRAPMRALRYLVDEAEGLAASGLGDQVPDILAKISAQSRRMSDMLGALFEYSSAGHKANLVTRTALRPLVEGIVGRASRADRFLVDVVGDWPVLETVAAPFELVMTNLIENAMKYHDQPIGRIVVGASDSPHHVVVTVTDDGPGIPDAHKQVVFLPFRRLDYNAAVEGSGMGLALVKRTLERIGGRIELVSPVAAGRGTTFRVHWPKMLAAG